MDDMKDTGKEKRREGRVRDVKCYRIGSRREPE
jgi:hypothetical protein